MQNIVAVDQEIHGLAVVINGKRTQIKSFYDLELPKGGGLLVADTNVWAVHTGLSVSQYCFDSKEDRVKFLEQAEDLGYKSISVSTKYAKVLYQKHNYSQADAVEALYDEVEDQVNNTGRFDSGRPVRESRGDVSFGMRAEVVKDFLMMQNELGKKYDSDFMDKAVDIAWHALDKEGQKLFKMKIRTPECNLDNRNRIAAVVVCTHDPATGERRMHNGKPWGIRFITRRILCLNGMMQGTGALSPGSPMRAVLRMLGKRNRKKGTINSAERAALDNQVKVLIRAFQQHEHI